MLGSGVDGVSGRELMMFAGGADGASEGARVSQGSSDSTFIVLIFFFLLSSLIFFLGRHRSKSAGRKKERNISTVCHEINGTKTLAEDLSLFLYLFIYSRTVPFRPMFVLESMSPRWISEVIKSGWS